MNKLSSFMFLAVVVLAVSQVLEVTLAQVIMLSIGMIFLVVAGAIALTLVASLRFALTLLGNALEVAKTKVAKSI